MSTQLRVRAFTADEQALFWMEQDLPYGSPAVFGTAGLDGTSESFLFHSRWTGPIAMDATHFYFGMRDIYRLSR